MTDYRLQYWDSPVFISYLTGRDPRRVDIAQRLLNGLRDGKFALVTSAFTLAEVRLYRTDPGVSGQNIGSREDEIAELFRSPLIEFRAVTDWIGREAWAIGRQNNDLTPADCIHIATAQDVPSSVLFTWDGSGLQGRRDPKKMLFYNGRLGTPPLAIEEPVDAFPELLNVTDPGRKLPLSAPPSEPLQQA